MQTSILLKSMATGFLCALLSFSPLSLAQQEPLSQRGYADSDPLESLNRSIFVFNQQLDRWLLRPLAQGYDYVTPNWMQQGISNTLANLNEVPVTVNAALQGRFREAGISTGRFLINSTLGLGGVLDTADKMGIPAWQTDFGHTLAVWGVPQGPYLMVPLLGPRTLRSGVGSIADVYMSPMTYSNNVRLRNTVFGLGVVSVRASLLDADTLMTGDHYLFVRDAYLQRREQKVNDGEVKDDFSEGFDDDWGDDSAL